MLFTSMKDLVNRVDIFYQGEFEKINSSKTLLSSQLSVKNSQLEQIQVKNEDLLKEIRKLKEKHKEEILNVRESLDKKYSKVIEKLNKYVLQDIDSDGSNFSLLSEMKAEIEKKGKFLRSHVRAER